MLLHLRKREKLAAVASGHPLPATPLIGRGSPACQPFPQMRGPTEFKSLNAPADSLPPYVERAKSHPGTELGAHTNHLPPFKSGARRSSDPGLVIARSG